MKIVKSYNYKWGWMEREAIKKMDGSYEECYEKRDRKEYGSQWLRYSCLNRMKMRVASTASNLGYGQKDDDSVPGLWALRFRGL